MTKKNEEHSIDKCMANLMEHDDDLDAKIKDREEKIEIIKLKEERENEKQKNIMHQVRLAFGLSDTDEKPETWVLHMLNGYPK